MKLHNILHILVPSACVAYAIFCAWQGDTAKGFLFIISGLIYFAISIPKKPPTHSNHFDKDINLN